MEQISILDDNKRIEINKRKKEVKFVAVDVETTGLSPVYNELIEISAIKYDGAKKIDTFSTLVKPKKEVSDIITNLTGITNKMLENAPQIEDVMPKLVEFIGNHIIVAHNANFDVSFLQNNSNKSFSKNKVIDMSSKQNKNFEIVQYNFEVFCFCNDNLLYFILFLFFLYFQSILKKLSTRCTSQFVGL